MQIQADSVLDFLGSAWIYLDLLKSSLRELFFEQKVPLENFSLSKKFPKKDEWVSIGELADINWIIFHTYC